MISGVVIRNFKAFREQRFRLAPLTILTGLNGSGKSSLMQAILLLKQSIAGRSLERGYVPWNGEFVKLGSSSDVLNESASEEEVFVRLEFSAGDSFALALQVRGGDERLAEVASVTGVPDLSLTNSDFVFLAAERISPQVAYEIPEDLPRAGKLGIHGERTFHYLFGYGSREIVLPRAAHSSARSLQLTHQAEAWLGEVSPGVQVHLDSQAALDLVRVSYSFKSRREVSRQYRATNVGFGVTYVLPVIVALLSSRPGDLVIIESPEAHLHPRGQSKVGELAALVAASGVQVLLETHSDHVMNGVRVAVHQDLIPAEDALFLYFRWNPRTEELETTVQEITLDADGRIATWPAGFFDEFDKSLDILLSEKPNR